MNNELNVLKKILGLLHIRYTNSFLKDSLYAHPNFPSLL